MMSQDHHLSVILADHHAAVIQSHWRGYKVRKSMQQDLQLMPAAPAAPADGKAAAGELQQQVAAVLHGEKQLVQCQQSGACLPDVSSEATGTVIRNSRGALVAASATRWPDPAQRRNQQLQDWQQFASNQARRYVPAPTCPTLQVLGCSSCYRLRIQSINGLPPMTQVNGTAFQLQLAVSLYNELLGVFYGNTCYSPVAMPQQQQQYEAAAATGDGVPGPQMDFCFDVFFHSAISDPHCLAVVELIMVEHGVNGAAKGSCSVGWAQLPLFETQLAQGAAGLQGKQGSLTAAAAVMSGTPRYLLFRSVCGNDLPTPAEVPGCNITYQAEVYPALEPVQPLLPPDFLVSYSDLVPGLRRFDCHGQLTNCRKNIISTLDSPMLAPVMAVSLDRLQVKVPQLLHRLISVLPQLAGTPPPPDLNTLLAIPSQPPAVVYSLQVGLHNGRRFVGRQLRTGPLVVQPNLGSIVLQPDAAAGGLLLDWLLADELVVVVAELLAAATTAAADENYLGCTQITPAVIVGRAVCCPFEQLAANGNSAVLAQGLQQLSLYSSCCSDAGGGARAKPGSCPAVLGSLSPGLRHLNWRALLRDTAVQAVPDPQLHFELMLSDRVAVMPQLAAPAVTPLPASASTSAVLTADDDSGCPATSISTAAAAAEAAAAPAVLEPAAPQPLPAAPHVPHDTRASRSLRLAAKHLEEAASIPVRELSLTSESLQHAQATSPTEEQPADAALLELAMKMQDQIGMLAKAVEGLKEERQTLRSSLTLLESAVQAHGHAQPVVQHMPCITDTISNTSTSSPLPSSPTAASSIHAAELERLNALQPTVCLADSQSFAGFTGAQAPAMIRAANAGGTPGVPSRAVLQQLHEAGMGQNLPTDVQTLLRRSSAAIATQKHSRHIPAAVPGSGGSIVSPLVLEVEGRDQCVASDVVLQLLAFKPTTAPAAAAKLPAALSMLYFTLQLYHFSPTVTEPCLLVASNRDEEKATAAGDQSLHMQGRADRALVLMPAQQIQRTGAGLVLKYQVDSTSGLLPGQDPTLAAYEGHMAFCQYLAGHKLAIDVWDGDSLLQLGSCAISLQGLLRQGREFAELLLEVPVMQACCPAAPQHQGLQQQQLLAGSSDQELGQLVLHLINIGKQPANAAARLASFDAAEAAASGPGTSGRRVRVRAAPLQPGSPVAKALRSSHGSSSPFAVGWQKQQPQQQGCPGDGGQCCWAGKLDSASRCRTTAEDNELLRTDAAVAAADIFSLEQRKVARERQLRQCLASDSRPISAPGMLQHPEHAAGIRGIRTGSNHSNPQAAHTVGGAALGGSAEDDADQLRAVQKQLLADVDAVRRRQKPGFIRHQLRKGLVTCCTLQPRLGQTQLLEHVLCNMLGRDAVFQLCISHPQQLQAIESMQEYQQLQLGTRAIGTMPVTGAYCSRDTTSAGSNGGGAAAAAAGCDVPSIAGLALHARLPGAAPVGQLVSRGKIFLSANEKVVVPFKFRLQAGGGGSDSNHSKHGNGQDHTWKQHQSIMLQEEISQHLVMVEFVPLDLDYPTNILELKVQPRPLIIDRTLRYHCPERDTLRAVVPLASLPGASQPLLAAAAAGRLVAAASMEGVSVTVSPVSDGAVINGSLRAAGHHKLVDVGIRYKSGLSPEVVHFMVWLYGDASMAEPLEVWQVFVHALRKVDMRCVVGLSCTTSLAVGGGTLDRQVMCYSSCPRELLPSPQKLLLPAGAVSALELTFKPTTPGVEWVRVHLVDVASKSLVHAFIVATDATLPTVSQQFEVELRAGSISQQQLLYTSPNNYQPRIVHLRTNLPWLLSCQPAVLQLGCRTNPLLQLVFDAQSLKAGEVLHALVFVDDEEDRNEDCMEFVVNVV